MARLTVMIRYSQRDAGVLYRTLKSIASQSALELIALPSARKVNLPG